MGAPCNISELKEQTSCDFLCYRLDTLEYTGNQIKEKPQPLTPFVTSASGKVDKKSFFGRKLWFVGAEDAAPYVTPRASLSP